MKAAVLTGVLCSVAAPAMGAAWMWDFDIVAGSLTVDMSPDGVATPDPVTVSMAGTFGMVIYASDGHIGQSDTFILRDSLAYNTEEVELSLMGLATARIGICSALFRDFAPVAPGHIGPGGISVISTDAYAEALVIVSGLVNTTLDTQTWAGVPLDFTVTVNSSAEMYDIVTVNIHGTFGYEVGMTGITLTLTLDLIVDVLGTVHWLPEPTLAGLVAMGLGGAGTWLRRRR